MIYNLIRIIFLSVLSLFFFMSCQQKLDKSDEVLIQKIANQILEARSTNTPIQPLSKTYENLNLHKAYELQTELSKKLSKLYGPIVGYKLGYSDSSSFIKHNINVPAYGPIFKSQIKRSADSIDANDYRNFSIECEIVFTIAKSIDKKMSSIDELKSFVESVHIGFDMSESIFNGPTTIVDFVANGADSKFFILSEGLDPVNTDVTNIPLSIVFGDSVIYKGFSKNVLGNPWIALREVANDLVKRGYPLKPGDVIYSGKVAPAFKIKSDIGRGLYKGAASSFPEINVLVK